MINFLFHALQGSGIDFIRGRDEIENGLKRLDFCFESQGLVEGFEAQFRFEGRSRAN